MTRIRSRRRLPRRLSFTLCGAAVLSCLSPSSVIARPANLDPSFGGGGRVATDFGDGGVNVTHDVVLQPDGKLVAVGGSGTTVAVGGTTPPGLGLARYNADGSLDPAFDDDGRQTTLVEDTSRDGATARSVALQADGRIVVLGTKCVKSGPGGCNETGTVIARYLSNGTLDPSFAMGGLRSFPSSVAGYPTSVAVQSDGRLLILGVTVLYRLLPSGDVDPSFGSEGRVDLSLPGRALGARDLEVQPDGRIVVAGTAGGGETFGVARYQADGSPDEGFGVGGFQATAFSAEQGAFSGANALAIQADRKIVLAGYSHPRERADTSFGLVRYSADGRLDPSFSGDGKQTITFPRGESADSSRAEDVVVQPDGRIVAAGEFSGSETPAYPLARLLPDGALDGTFGRAGRRELFARPQVVTSFAGPPLRAAAIQPDGKIIAAGREIFRLQGGADDLSSRADLSVSESHMPNRVLPLGRVTYRVTIRNDGPEAATGVRLQQDLARRVYRVRVDRSDRCRVRHDAFAASIIACRFDRLEAGGTVTVAIELDNDSSRDDVALRSFLTVSSSEVDPRTEDNSPDSLVPGARSRSQAGARPPRVRLRLLGAGGRCVAGRLTADVRVRDDRLRGEFSYVYVRLDRRRIAIRRTRGRVRIRLPVEGLARGRHTVRVRGSDVFGNSAEAFRSFRRC